MIFCFYMGIWLSVLSLSFIYVMPSFWSPYQAGFWQGCIICIYHVIIHHIWKISFKSFSKDVTCPLFSLLKILLVSNFMFGRMRNNQKVTAWEFTWTWSAKTIQKGKKYKKSSLFVIYLNLTNKTKWLSKLMTPELHLVLGRECLFFFSILLVQFTI